MQTILSFFFASRVFFRFVMGMHWIQLICNPRARFCFTVDALFGFAHIYFLVSWISGNTCTLKRNTIQSSKDVIQVAHL